MKSYNHLYEKFIDKENIKAAIYAAAKGKKDKKYVENVLNNIDTYLPKAVSYAANFQPARHTPKEIYDGIQHKKRQIIVPLFSEQVIHHAAVQVLAPIFMSGMYEHSYASIPGRGLTFGMKIIKKWIRHDRRNTKYYVKMDVRKFFASIDRENLLNMLAKKIHDKKFFNILQRIIMLEAGNGLPLGFYTSQWFANFYLTGLDHFIKNKLRVTYYIRYMDDMVLFGSNKRKLRRDMQAIATYIEKIGLRLKENYQLARFHYAKHGKDCGRFLDFLGFRFYRNRITLRRSLMLKLARKACHIAKKKGECSIYEARQMISYWSWLKHTDSYKLYTKRIKPYVDFRVLRNKIKMHDRRKNNGMERVGKCRNIAAKGD